MLKVDGSMSWVRGAGLAVIVAAALAGCGTGGGRTSASSSYEVAETVKALRVDGHGGDIRIVTGSGPIKVTETMQYGDKKPVSRHSVSDGKLLLQSDRCDVDGVCNVDYEIRIPGTLTAKLSSGGGAVEVTGVGAPVEIDSGGGRVVVGKLSADLTVRSGGGAVEAGLSAEPESVTVDTSGGGARITLPGGPYAVEADSGGGPRDVSVETDDTSVHKVTVRTSGGDITIRAA
jgi:hypothetical protein